MYLLKHLIDKPFQDLCVIKKNTIIILMNNK